MLFGSSFSLLVRLCPSPSVLCCLLAPLLAPSVWPVSLCVFCFGLSPFVVCFPLLAGFSLVVFVSSGSSVAWILRLPLYIIALSFHLNYIGRIFSNSEFVCGGADSCHRPSLRFTSFCLFVVLGCLIHVAFRWLSGKGPSRSVCCFCDFSGRGGRSLVEPWTRLHCSELYWRCPVVLPAVQSGAPSCSKACQHTSSSLWLEHDCHVRAAQLSTGR